MMDGTQLPPSSIHGNETRRPSISANGRGWSDNRDSTYEVSSFQSWQTRTKAFLARRRLSKGKEQTDVLIANPASPFLWLSKTVMLNLALIRSFAGADMGMEQDKLAVRRHVTPPLVSR